MSISTSNIKSLVTDEAPGQIVKKLFTSRLSQEFARAVVVPVVALAILLGVWAIAAANITTSLGQLPGPVQVAQQAMQLVDEHRAERQREADFYERQERRNADTLAEDPNTEVQIRPYTGNPTFFDQILTSIITVSTGFLLASLIAIPVGIAAGMSTTLYRAINPVVQIFKPVSPLAWLPIVTILVSALYVTEEPMFSKSFLTSAITVMLCAIWPTIINTTVGVSSVDRDLINVSRVLRLGWLRKTLVIVLPSSVPMMFAGLRLSLGIGWMVLIAAEMLAQNPGLGKFVWDEFQNGSSNSMARIMVAVLVIGFIGFLLDRGMLALQKKFTWDPNAVLR